VINSRWLGNRNKGVIITLLTIIDSWEKRTSYRRGSPTEKEILFSDKGWRFREGSRVPSSWRGVNLS